MVTLMNYYYNGINYRNIKTTTAGRSSINKLQQLAITAALLLNDIGFKINENCIKRGIEKVVWLGRLSVISQDPLIVIDGAHNEDGVQALSLAIKKYFKDKELILIMGMLKDKEHDKSLKILTPMAKILIATEPISERALKAEELGEEAKIYCSNVKLNPHAKAIKIALMFTEILFLLLAVHFT